MGARGVADARAGANYTSILKVNAPESATREPGEPEERLREADRSGAETLTLLETLQSTAPVGFGFIDRHYRIVRMNETLAAVNGLPLEDQLGRTLPEVAPELWPDLEHIYRHVLDSGEAVVEEIEAPSQEGSGQVLFWLASYYPVEVKGEVVGVGLVTIDITEGKRAEDLRSVVMENMVEGVFAVDHEGRLALMNAAASRMLGWREDDLLGKPIHEAIHFQRADGSAYPPEDCELNHARVDGRTVRTNENAYTRRDGSIFPVCSSAAPLLTDTSIRGAVVVFRDTTEETEERVRMRRELDALTWVGRLREALDGDRFVLYSQPIVPLAGGDTWEELLLRMVDRSGAIVPPGSFLPVAEKFGLIGEIDTWVVSEAIRLAAGRGRVTANLSAESVSSLDLVTMIESELRGARADPADIVFEITETSLMEDLEAGEAFARGLAEVGCGLALDDFGTGFGSFTYLKAMPLDYLKIDTEFIRDIVSDRASQHLVKATVGLAEDFGYQTIAEGVEDPETLALLGDCGVDYAQGFYLGRPAPVVGG